MEQTYRIILANSESYNIIKQVPERIVKDKFLIRQFLYKNHFLPALYRRRNDPQYIIIPEPICEENIESFYVPKEQECTNEIPYVAREY